MAKLCKACIEGTHIGLGECPDRKKIHDWIMKNLRAGGMELVRNAAKRAMGLVDAIVSVSPSTPEQRALSERIKFDLLKSLDRGPEDYTKLEEEIRKWVDDSNPKPIVVIDSLGLGVTPTGRTRKTPEFRFRPLKMVDDLEFLRLLDSEEGKQTLADVMKLGNYPLPPPDGEILDLLVIDLSQIYPKVEKERYSLTFEVVGPDKAYIRLPKPMDGKWARVFAADRDLEIVLVGDRTIRVKGMKEDDVLTVEWS
jgi:hypothetical protein